MSSAVSEPVLAPVSRPAALLEVEDLRTEIVRGRDRAVAIDGISLTVHRGEVVALVGESGSGKSLTALSVLRLLRDPVRVTKGSVRLDGVDLLGLTDRQMRAVRGSEVGMIFQDPMTALNPFHTVEKQIAETLDLHGSLSRGQMRARTLELLGEVGIVNPRLRMTQFPYELSGGTQQRVMIAMAMANNPKLLVADEPTTGLDATVQAQIMLLVKRLAADHDAGVLIITHDLGLVSGVSDSTVVMYAGEVVETGRTADVLVHGRHPYTRALIGATPRVDGAAGRLTAISGAPPDLQPRPTGCRFHPRCPRAEDRCRTDHPLLTIASGAPKDAGSDAFRCWVPMEEGAADLRVLPVEPAPAVEHEPAPAVEHEPAPVVQEGARGETRAGSALIAAEVRREFAVGGIGRRSVTKAVDGISLEVGFGETLGIVGESGCGKSTLAKLLAGLDRPTSGDIVRGDRAAPSGRRSARDRRVDERGFVQFVFQDTFGSLDPRRTVLQSVSEPLQNMASVSRAERDERALSYLASCGLPESAAGRYPHELSGGQRQRVGIARALVVEPDLIVMDEPMSGLDVSVQAQIVNLLQDLRREHGLTAVLVSHDVGVVRHLSDRVAVMYLGRIVEVGPADDVIGDPQHPYTAALVSAIPLPDPEQEARRQPILLRGDIGDTQAGGTTGCVFATRCPVAQDRCRTDTPVLTATADGPRQVACHFPGTLDAYQGAPA
jgi:peptide/nickel transport system ATP-binding protein